MVILKSALTCNFSQLTGNQVSHGKRVAQKIILVKRFVQHLGRNIPNLINTDQLETNDSESEDMITYDKEINLNTTKEFLNNALNELDISTVKKHSVATHSKPTLGKRKI